MGHQVIRQPDGQLAVFSTVVDSWILFDATPEEILDWYAEDAAARSRESTARVLAAVAAGDPGAVYYQFAMTFQEADDLSAVHGQRLADLQAGHDD